MSAGRPTRGRAPVRSSGPLIGAPPTRPGPGLDHTGLMADPSDQGRARVVLGLVIVAVGYLLATSLLTQAGAALSWLARGREGSFTDGYTRVVSYGVVEGVAIVNLALASVILVVLAVLRGVNGRSAGWICSVEGRLRVRLLGGGLVIGLLVLNGVYLLVQGGGERQGGTVPQHVWLWVLLVVLTSPLQAAGEEFLFRGYLQQAVGAITGRAPVAVVVSAVVFALMHGTQDAALFADRLGFGLVAGAMVVLTGGLEASIAVHAANNVSSFCYAIAAGTLTQTRQITTSNWPATASNVLAYTICGVLAVLLSRLLGARRRSGEGPV